MLRKILPLLLAAALFSCSEKNTSDKQDAVDTQKKTTEISMWQPPKAGTVIDKVQERITEDKLNEKYFRVTVTATDESKKGTYALKLEHGFNSNETTIDMPEWVGGAVLKPVLKKGPDKYNCIVGFDTGDGEFHELYQVKVNDKGSITLKQTKGYYQERK